MPSLRFENPSLQSRFIDGLKRLSFEPQIAADGSVVCSDEQWPEVNTVAHDVRDTCFKWYFSWCRTEESTKELEQRLRSQGLRFEIEHHDGRIVFLLPVSDQDKHLPASEEYSGPETCSFCNAPYTERKQFVVSGDSAICDRCIEELHAELRGDK